MLRTNLPSQKPELWANLPRALWRKAMHRVAGPKVVITKADADILMEVDTRDAIGRTIHFYGCWEHPLTEFLRSYLKPNMVFLDVGANIGYFALFAAKRCRRAYAIEASPNVYRRLARNVEINPSLPMQAFHLAASDSSGPITFYLDDDEENHGLSSLVRQSTHPVVVDGVTLDEFCSALPKIDIMKIDVEGAEERVFRGAGKWIERDNPAILFESHPNSTAHMILRNLGYSITELPSRSFEAPNCFATRSR